MWIAPYGVAPEIQPCIRFAKAIAPSYQLFRNTAPHTEEPIALGGVNGAARGGITAAFLDPIDDGIGELLCLGIEGVGNKAHLCQLIHYQKRLLAILDTEYAFQSYNAAGPSAGIYIVGIAAVPGPAWTERRPGCKPKERAHQPLACRYVGTGQLDPFVGKEAFHGV